MAKWTDQTLMPADMEPTKPNSVLQRYVVITYLRFVQHWSVRDFPDQEAAYRRFNHWTAMVRKENIRSCIWDRVEERTLVQVGEPIDVRLRLAIRALERD